MASTSAEDEVFVKIREKLNREKIKLWLPPYTNQNGEKGDTPQELAARYSSELNMEISTVLTILEQLRQHALEKLAAKRKMLEQGRILLKIKLTGNNQNMEKSAIQTLEVALTSSGHDLKQRVAEHYGISESRLKLISCGRVIDDQKSIQEQFIKHNSTVMAVFLSESEAESHRFHHQASKLAKTLEAAEFISSKAEEDDADDYFLQIADQTGRSLQLPAEERKALTLAMTLHEKGRADMKRKDHATGLLLLLEADKEFKKCRSEILGAVDNYAVLCLDIVWCYLCLKNINDLPDAEVRLRSCEECFNKSYGANLERLNSVKGGTGTEEALFMRLHLLQGIVAYHQNRTAQAESYLNTADRELRRLQVDDDKLTAVMAMGFSMMEARLGLRACSGDVQLTIDHIIKKKEEKRLIKEKDKEKRKNQKLAKKLGKTANGEWVNADFYNNLLSMGFVKGASREALRQSNNNLSLAIQVLQDKPELLALPDPDIEEVDITDDMLTQVMSLGFDEDSAYVALKHFSGSIQRAIEELLKVGGVAPPSWDVDSSDEDQPGPSTSKKSKKQKEREKKMIESIVPDIPESEEDYLDLTLEEEAQFLEQYKALLMSMK